MRLRHLLSLATLPAACCLLVPCLTASAQSTATITGTVTDPTGAVIAHAHVTVHSLATGQDRSLDTDGAGLYVVPSLEPGDYSVRATAAGFSPYSITKVTLDVDRNVTVNMKLPIESAGETVQVEESGTLIEAQTITVGQVIDARTVQELPLNGRHFLDLTTLTPGGVVAPTAGSLTGASRGLGANSFITAGNREDSVNFQINGVNLNDMSQNQITFQPSINTTSEFKIDNSTFSAEYGRSSGSIVNVSTRSGTNKFHGEVFDYFRNEALDARNFFNRAVSPTTGQTAAKAPLKRNNFGASVGGPIFRDHTFFFASYEGLRQHQGILQNSLVFTAAQRAYILSQGNATATALLNLVPLPNSGTNSYVGYTPGPVQIDQGTADILQVINAKDQVHVFYAFQRDQRTEPALQGDTVPGFGDHRLAHRQVATLNETHIFNPNTVNDLRLGFNRINIAFIPNVTTDPSTLGIGTGVTGPVGIPQTTFSDLGLVIGGPSGFPQGRVDSLGLINDTLTLVRGKHTIKAGGEGRRFLGANFAQDTGTLTFATSTGVNTPTSTSANIFAAGLASGFAQTPSNVVSRVYVNAVDVFLQDNYKLTPRFTAELGVRFEYNGTPTEGKNRFYIFNPLTLSVSQTNTNGVGGAYNQNYNFEPRVGFAWDVLGTTKTVLRGGYAILADQPTANVVGGLTSNPPATNRVAFVGSATQTVPVGTAYQSSLASGISLADVNPRLSVAYTETYNVNVQQDFGLGLVGSVGYYGSVGKHLRIATNENQPTGPAGATNLTQVRPFLALAANSPYAAGKSINANISEVNSTGYSMYNGLWATMAKTFHNGIEFNVNYEWTKSMDTNSLGSQGGFNLEDSLNPNLNYGLSDFDTRNHFAGTAIYAFPKRGENRLLNGYRLETIIQYQTGNPINLVASSDNFNGVAGVVRPNILGKIVTQKQYVPGATNVTFIQNPGGLAFGGTVCDSTNVTAACVFQVRGTQANATGTTAPSVYTGVGTAHRNSVTGPGFADVDVTGEKETKITERLAFTLRADAFDILNHPNFGQPSANVQSSAFGQITGTRFAISDGGSSRQLQISGKFTF